MDRAREGPPIKLLDPVVDHPPLNVCGERVGDVLSARNRTLHFLFGHCLGLIPCFRGIHCHLHFSHSHTCRVTMYTVAMCAMYTA
jgi:hypothetical protein